MSSTFKRAALGTMQEIPLSSSYDGDTSGQITKVSDDVQSPQRGSKMSVGARLNYATGDDYSIDSYKIDTGGNTKSSDNRPSPSRSIDLSRIGTVGSGGDHSAAMANSSSDDQFEQSVPRTGSRGSRRVHREALEKGKTDSLSSTSGNQEIKSLRKQQLERELELLETEIQRKREVIDKTEKEVSRVYDNVAQAKDEESDALYRQRVAKLAAEAEEARKQRQIMRAGDDYVGDNDAQGKAGKSRNSVQSVRSDPSTTNDHSFDEERRRFEKERNELQEKLEIMEMQNKLLASRVERTETRAQELIREEEKKREAVEQAELEAKQALEVARAEKTLAISQLEGEARDQLESEKQEREELERERASLRAKLAAIEASEKDAQETLQLEKAQREELKRSLEEERRYAEEAKRAQALTSEQLEMERKVREDAIAKLEEEKRSMLKEQEARHKAIASEKEELRSAMKAMEEEKKALYERVETTEKKAQEEIQQLELHKVEYEMSIRRLEEEKQDLDRKMRSVEQQSEMVTEAMADQLAAEKNKLLEGMKKLEQEKTFLAASLDESTAKSLAAQEEMTKRLELERAQLKESLEKMEGEKKTLASHLEQSIRDSREKSKEIQAKTAEESTKLQAAILQAEVEKAEIARRLEENQAQVAKEVELKSQSEHAEALVLLEKEREALKQSMEAMAKEKEEMQRHLREAEEEAKLEKEKELQRNMREKEELKAAVQKMKEELRREKRAAEEARAAAARAQAAKEAVPAPADGNNSVEKGQEQEQNQDLEQDDNAVKTLKPSKSLYDMFQEEGPEDSAGPQLPRTLSKALLESPMPHTIDVIAEGDETQEENIFGVEDSDDWGDAASMGSKASRVSKGSKSGVKKNTTGNSSGEKKKGKKGEKQSDPFDDLPAPHAAAAGGDLARLKMLGRLEPSLLSSFDAAHRCPLFYAVAYGQTEVTKFLTERCPEMVAAVDAHGDTPLHAAASGGSSECTEILLATCRKRHDGTGADNTPATNHDGMKHGDIANPRNAMHMTPCHLARSADVVEVLYNYGADLSAQDNNGRSPLFVACAMNREPCADLIINSLDREGKTDEIYEKDRRGDTALHAAACNGSVDCLLLLLQYGVDPTVGNNKNLKAIDLAARNGHVRCRDVLAEYHLHFCTSSEFDSVLFLATLQGHKKVKEGEKSRDMPPTASDEEGSYNIIKKKSSFSLGSGGGSGSPGADMPKGLKHVQSMFSLKTQKSLRVQRWGEWIAYEDQQTSHIYWYNHSKGTGQWEKPEEVAKLQLEAALDASGAGSPEQQGKYAADALSPAHSLSPKKSMRLKKHGDWIEYITETSQTFFYNEKNGEFQWTAPPGVVPRSATKGEVTPKLSPGGNQPGSPEHTLLNNQASSDVMTPEASTQPHVEGSSGAVHTDWQPYKDPDSGNIFWYNAVTQVSQWECPLDNVDVISGEYQGATQHETRIEDEDEEAVEVVGEDDLGI